MAKQYGNFTDFISVARASSGTCLRKVKFGQDIYSEIVDKYISNGNTDGTWSTDTGLLALDWVPVTANTYYQLVAVGGPADRYRYQFKLSDDSYTTAVTDDQTWLTKTLKTPANAVEMRVYYKSGAGTASSMTVRSAELDHKDGELILFNHPENVARVEYDEYGRVIGTLIEESRTNSITYSEDQSNAAWTKTTAGGATVSVIPSSYQTPDGGYNGYQISNLDTSGDRLDFFSPTAAVSGASWTYSAWFRGSGLVRITVNTSTGVGGGAEVNVVLTDEWVRHTTTVTFSSPTGNVRAHGAITRVTGAAPEVHIYGAQLEAGAFPTSYIPTSGSTATRAADIDSIDVSQFGYNQKAGSVVVEFLGAEMASGETKRLMSLNDGTSSNRMDVLTVASGQSQLYVVDGGVNVVGQNSTTTDVVGEFSSAAMAYEENDYALSMDGGTVATDTSATVPTVSSLSVGNSPIVNYRNGHIKSIKYIPRRLTNDQLEALSS